MKAIIAIDPGPTYSAFVIWTGKGILDHGKISNHELAHRLNGFYDIPVVIEMIASYGMAVGAEVFETCVWIGRFMEQLGDTQYRRECDRMFRKEVKMHLCHSMRAKDANIRQALVDRLGKPGTKKKPGITHGITKDQWAALALAVTWLDKQSNK